LTGCELITDRSVQELKNCRLLELRFTSITNEVIEELNKNGCYVIH
jgi:hypothetical protein